MPKAGAVPGEARIVGLYAEAKKKILGELTRMAISSYNEAKAQEARIKVAAIVAILDRAVIRQGQAALRRAYAEQSAATAIQAEILGFETERRGNAGLQESISRLRRYIQEANATIKRSAENFLAAFRMAAGAVSKIQEFDDEERALYIGEVEAASRTAVASNWSRRRLQSMLLDKLYKLVENGDFIVINGRNYDIAKYAKMVVRTEFRRAQTAASLDTCERYNCDLVEWSRHANACELCLPHEGQVFSRSGKDPKYPPLAGLEPPLHPNCGHSVLATSREAIAARGGGG
jgi:hypothetical protein